MKTLEKGQEKIKKICSVLREETLEPAKKQAEEIIKEAQGQRDALIAEGKKHAEEFLAAARASMEQERKVFQSSLQQAVKQSLDTLRQEVEQRFFDENLYGVIENNAGAPDLAAKLINAIVHALEKEGLATNLTALVPKDIAPSEINAKLLHDVLQKLKDKSVGAGSFKSGAQVKLNDKKLVIDISEDALVALLASFIVRKDFRKMVFASEPVKA